MMDLSEKQRCLLCNRGGKLLVCYDDGCPISVHKNCMGCEARFDEFGNFRCPYCLYRQFAAETCRLREKAILAKRALSAFLDEHMRDGNWPQEQKTRTANKKEKTPLTDKACLEKKNNMVSDDNQKQSIHLEKHQNSKTHLPYEGTQETSITRQASELNNGNTCRIMVVYEGHSLPKDACGVDHASFKENGMNTDQIEDRSHRTKSGEHKNGVADDQQHATSMKEAQANSFVISSSIEKRRSNHKKRNYGNRIKEDCMTDEREIDRRNASNGLEGHTSSKKHKATHLSDPPNGAVAPQETVNSSNHGELKDSSKLQSVIVRNTKLPSPNGKRRVLWSVEEEDMLKEGVQKYSLTINKNIPWKKVLEFGRHVFDASRTPSDLKDKWRKIAK